MFWSIFLFELRYRIKRPATWLYFAIFFFLGFLFISAGNTPATEKVYHNAPHTITFINILFSMVMMLVCSAVMGVPLYRDIEHHTRQYLFSYPITKAGYFWGRFAGSFVFVLFIGTALSWGEWLGSLAGPALGWAPAERYGSFGAWNYFQSYFVYGISNLLLASAIFFALVAVTRNVRVIYSGSILLFIGYLLAAFLVRDIDKSQIVKLLDPFAVNTFELATRYWTPFEKNTMLYSLQGDMLLNRVIWMAVAAAIILWSYWRFSFTRFLLPETAKGSKLKDAEEKEPYFAGKVPSVSQVFDRQHSRRVWWSLTKIEFLSVIRDNYFKAILLGGIVFLIIDFWIGNLQFGVGERPLTIFLMDYKNYNYSLFIFIILLFYSGESIHREKGTNFNIINDALPVSNRVFLWSKLAGLFGVAFFLSNIPIVAGLLVQIVKGVSDFRFDVYFIEMYVLTLPFYLQMVLLSFAVHLLVNNKFGGHGVALLIWIVMFLLRTVGQMNYNLFFYSYAPEYRWSDMNGLGHFLKPQMWFTAYWLALGFLLFTLSSLFYQRGITGGFREKWRVAMQRFTAPQKLTATLLTIAWLGSGVYIFYNVSVVNNYLTNNEGKKRQADREKALNKYDRIPQPKVTRVVMKADIFPDDRRVQIQAKIYLKNKEAVPVDILHLAADEPIEYSILYNGQPVAYTSPLVYKKNLFGFWKKHGDTANYRLYKLPAPLMPGDSAVLDVTSTIAYKGFVNSGLTRQIVYNGTFYDGGLPSIGYSSQSELSSDEDRKKYGLPPKPDDLPPFDDAYGKRTLLFNDDADLIQFEATLSTVPDQIAIAPGYLQKEWTENGRRYFHYVQDSPIDYFFNIVSAKYEVMRDAVTITGGQKVNMEIFYHKNHAYNLDRMMASYRDGLLYFSDTYGPFQFRQMRLLEFPRYAAFAQSFPNTVPYSEAFGWVADMRDPNTFDYVYWVTAHELAHQWWGHQVVPNLTQGSNLTSESLAEYTALLLTERKYGRDNMKRFLKDELDGYLRGRANESKKENIYINCNRPYQWYQKGSLILYGLRELIGDKALNTAIREFRDSFAFRELPPYAGSHDLYNAIARHTPDSFRYFLDDSWLRITLYENRLLTATAKPAGNNAYDVTLEFSAGKFYADSTGKETKAPMNDYVEIGVFAEETTDKDGRRKTNPLYLQKHKLQPGIQKLTVRVNGKPATAGIDPYNKLIDRIPNDNTGAVD
jgi:hypothetical protein